MEKSYQSREGLLLRSAASEDQTENKSAATTSSHDFVLQWGNRKRLRCKKFQNSDRNNKNDSAGLLSRTDRADRRVVRSDNHNKDSNVISNGGNGYFNLRQRPSSPSNRILRNSETMRGQQSNGVRGLASPDRGHDKRGGGGGHNNINHHDTVATTTTTNNTRSNKNNTHDNNNNNNNNNNNCRGGRSPSSETTNDGKKGGSPSGSDPIPAVWHPKFAIALTNKEKEEDFLVLKGSKLPQRPKKRAKLVQRTVNLISPGTWLCDLSLERYEVREKKVSKKRPRGLKAMGNMESDSE